MVGFIDIGADRFITRSELKTFFKRLKFPFVVFIYFSVILSSLILRMSLKMAFESEYKLEDVAVTRISSDKIDETFRSSTIGE